LPSRRANSPSWWVNLASAKTAVVEGLARLIEMEPEKVPARLRGAHVVNCKWAAFVRARCCAECSKKELRASSTESQGTRQSNPLHRRGALDHGRRRGVRHIFPTRRYVQVGPGAWRYAHHRRHYALGIKEYILKTEALARRFRLVKVIEPSISENARNPFGLRPRLERNYFGEDFR